MDTRSESSECCLILSVEEARRKLGLSRGLMYKAIKRGQIPHLVIGRRILIPKKSFSQWLDRLHISPQEERSHEEDV
jgi:excisionase family DNA binding protein